jgi:hypothetical protein
MVTPALISDIDSCHAPVLHQQCNDRVEPGRQPVSEAVDGSFWKNKS